MRPSPHLVIWFLCSALGCATPPSDAPSQQNHSEPPPTHDANSNPNEGEGIGTCTEGQTQECCGDTVCDGPETPENCPTDCPANEASETSEDNETKIESGEPPTEPNDPAVNP